MEKMHRNQGLNENLQKDIDAILHKMRHSPAALPKNDRPPGEPAIHIDVDAILSGIIGDEKPQIFRMQRTDDSDIRYTPHHHLSFHTPKNVRSNFGVARYIASTFIYFIIQPLVILAKRLG